MHRLIGDLIDLMPQDGSPWPRPARDRWLAALGSALDLLYEDDAVPSPRATGAGSPVLDLRSEPPEQGGRRAKHARPVSPLV